MFSSLLVLDSYPFPRSEELEVIKEWLLQMAKLSLKLKEGEKVAAGIKVHSVKVFTLPPHITFSGYFLTSI
jgi:hypothetical protein